MTTPQMPARRTALFHAAAAAMAAGAAVSIAGCGGAEAATAEPLAGTFPTQPERIVLLHGSWHGGWCWDKVRPRLLAAGYDTWTPTFTGMAERGGSGSLAVGLTSHIEETVKLLEFHDLQNVVLVGHSYAGIVMSGVAERAASRIKRLVYLDAFVLRDGESAFDFFPPPVRDLFISLATSGNGWGFPPPPVDDLVGADAAAEDKARLTRLLTPTPLNTHAQKLAAPTGAAAGLPRTFISCKRFPNLDAIKARVRSERNWIYQELDTYHDCMLTTPADLAALLVQAAQSPRATAP